MQTVFVSPRSFRRTSCIACGENYAINVVTFLAAFTVAFILTTVDTLLTPSRVSLRDIVDRRHGGISDKPAAAAAAAAATVAGDETSWKYYKRRFGKQWRETTPEDVTRFVWSFVHRNRIQSIGYTYNSMLMTILIKQGYNFLLLWNPSLRIMRMRHRS